jgi:hypothetical protein
MHLRSLIIGAVTAICIAVPATAGHLHPEKYYQDQWCSAQNGVQEYALDDGARVDCLTDQYAVEFDFAPKWAEGIGQALYYAEKTGRRPGVALIMENNYDVRYLYRLQAICEKYGITIWQITP